MGTHHTVKIKIEFNEHDNEEFFIDLLKKKLQEFNEEFNTDLWITIDWNTLHGLEWLEDKIVKRKEKFIKSW